MDIRFLPYIIWRFAILISLENEGCGQRESYWLVVPKGEVMRKNKLNNTFCFTYLRISAVGIVVSPFLFYHTLKGQSSLLSSHTWEEMKKCEFGRWPVFWVYEVVFFFLKSKRYVPTTRTLNLQPCSTTLLFYPFSLSLINNSFTFSYKKVPIYIRVNKFTKYIGMRRFLKYLKQLVCAV